MDQLEFALVPVGIVLGYGVTKILGSWAHVIRIWSGEEQPPLLFISATAFCLLFMYLNFSGLWTYRGVEFELTSGIFNVIYLLAITLPMLLFMLAVSVLVPTDINELNNLDAHYIDSALPFHLIFASATGSSLLPDLLPGVAFTPRTEVILIIMALFISLGFVRNRAIHLSAHAIIWPALLFLNIVLIPGDG